ncbi:toxin-antitoxin system YwqK family antitoxin [Flavobacteriaceae bacterium XHP0103]|uniref:toxin-antitoxin system YwqK family antitoxin n=1 Tax=Marixanthotalea marina TaxID=2844359 RepID=UPI002989E232|nr:toxin-antitoxin system YwqK family antitoxin [Marixanthotalea marina]MBU3821359.1 toxin-antitoxin system YwqK family antitoxin [Marixanthotalea marina]
MKAILFIATLFFAVSTSAQTINQFDENGERHGVWRKHFDNTNILRYEGEFNHGKEVGLFKFYQNIGKKAVLAATKEFLEDSGKANVKFFASTGKLISEGQMNGKLYIGAWKFYQKDSDELLILEHYNEEGNLDGDRFVYYKNGETAEKQHYENGKLDGESLWYSEDKVLIKQMMYVGGKLDGLSKFYGPEGKLIIEGTYKDDKKVGVWEYFENGDLVEEKSH